MPASTAVIDTFAGSTGSGPATSVAQGPNALAATASTLYVSDGTWSAIRAIDLRTGDERLVATGLANPVDVAADQDGNLFIVDYANHRIRKLDVSGAMTTVVGTGQAGFGGDGGRAIDAQLDTPNGVSVDASGNVYVADTNNQRIRKVDANGTVTTVVGSGERGYAGDGGAATAAKLSAPSGVHVDSAGEIYIADSDNHCIRKVDRDGVIGTVAGTGEPGFSGDGGPATAAQLNLPFSVFVDALGVLYIPDFGNERVRRIGPSGVIVTVVGTGAPGFQGDGGPATAAQVRSVTDVAEDAAGNLYLSDLGNRRVRRVSPDGRIESIAGNGSAGHSGDGGPATAAQMLFPADLCFDRDVAYISDARNNRVRRVDRAGIITTIAGTGRTGAAGDGGAATEAQLNRPCGVCPDGAGGFYVADRANHKVRRVSADGRISTMAGVGAAGDAPDGTPGLSGALNAPSGIALGGAEALWIADTLNHRVRRLGRDGTMTIVAGTGAPGHGGDDEPATQAQLNTPTGIAVGADGAVYVADTLNHRVRRIDAAGTITTFAGTGEPGHDGDGSPARQARLNAPTGLVADAAGGLLIVDSQNRRIRRVDAAGTITTVGGSGIPGLSGDGGSPLAAELRFADDPRELSGIEITPAGAIYVADTANHRVRRIATAGAAAPDDDVIDGSGAPPAHGTPVWVSSAVGTLVLYRGRDGHIHELRKH